MCYGGGVGGNVVLYIFTDDANKAKKYIPSGYDAVFVSGQITQTALEDFYLMQQAKAIITSNSTFSWWAAYLNVHDDAKVVVPENWYLDAPYDDKDVYCINWIKL